MSSRLFKKVVKEQEQQQQRQETEEEIQLNDNESESPNSAPVSSINPFDLLNDGDEDHEPDPDSDQETEVADEALIRNKERKELSAEQNTTDVVTTSNHKSKKKKKKKGKEVSASSTDKVERSLDTALDALSLNVTSSSNEPGSRITKLKNAHVVKQDAPSILQIDPKYLNVENELRRIFGSKVVKSFERINQSGSFRQVHGGRRGSHHIRKTVLVSPADQWPLWDGSFSMEFLETKDGYNYFRYVHSPSYGQAQRAFEAAQAIMILMV